MYTPKLINSNGAMRDTLAEYINTAVKAKICPQRSKKGSFQQEEAKLAIFQLFENFGQIENG